MPEYSFSSKTIAAVITVCITVFLTAIFDLRMVVYAASPLTNPAVDFGSSPWQNLNLQKYIAAAYKVIPQASVLYQKPLATDLLYSAVENFASRFKIDPIFIYRQHTQDVVDLNKSIISVYRAVYSDLLRYPKILTFSGFSTPLNIFSNLAEVGGPTATKIVQNNKTQSAVIFSYPGSYIKQLINEVKELTPSSLIQQNQPPPSAIIAQKANEPHLLAQALTPQKQTYTQPSIQQAAPITETVNDASLVKRGEDAILKSLHVSNSQTVGGNADIGGNVTIGGTLTANKIVAGSGGLYWSGHQIIESGSAVNFAARDLSGQNAYVGSGRSTDRFEVNAVSSFQRDVTMSGALSSAAVSATTLTVSGNATLGESTASGGSIRHLGRG
jgi:hypothetical protein